MFLLIYCLLLFGLVTIATLIFKALAAHRIPNDVLRVNAVGCFLLAAVGGMPGALWLLSDHFLSRPGLIYSQRIDDNHYFTRQQVFWVTSQNDTTGSRIYDLRFYQRQPFRLDKELGQVSFECRGMQSITATILQGKRLLIKADNSTAIDTTLDFNKPFILRYSLPK